MDDNNQIFEQNACETEVNTSSESYEDFPDTDEPPRSFSPLESLFAWLSLLAGYIFCRVFPANDNPLGAVIFILSLFIATFIVLSVKKIKIGLLPIISACSAIIISMTLIFSGNAFLNFFAYSYALITYFYFIYSSTGNTLQNGFSNFILVDFIKALFILPFHSIGCIFRALFSSHKVGKFSLKILAGLSIAIIPTAIVLSLLSYDSSFLSLWNSIFRITFDSILSQIVSIIFGIPIGMYIFGLFISSVDNQCTDILTAEFCKNSAENLKRIPVLTVVSATAPILFVYIIFFISQWQYYISGFIGKLPENFSYAEYAREGFFQLCTVSILNLIIIITVMLVMRRTGDRPSFTLKLLSLLFAAFTLILISTAIAKMAMYINYYGLTQKRIYSTWLMIVLALIFIFIAIQQFVPNLKSIVLSFTVVVALFTVLSLSNVNGIIAKHNVDRYISGDLKTVDISALTELGDAAVPELVKLYDYIEDRKNSKKMDSYDFDVYSLLKKELKNIKTKYELADDNVFSFTLPGYRAKKAINNWNK